MRPPRSIRAASPSWLVRVTPSTRYTGSQDRCLGGVRGPIAELVSPADVIKVRMGEDHQRVPFEHERDLRAQCDDTKPGIDDDVTVGSPQPPQLRRKQRVDVWLRDTYEVTGCLGLLVPASGGPGLHGVFFRCPMRSGRRRDSRRWRDTSWDDGPTGRMLVTVAGDQSS
jgi:hypothetical protein